jgi:hypothetical protein
MRVLCVSRSVGFGSGALCTSGGHQVANRRQMGCNSVDAMGMESNVETWSRGLESDVAP